MRNLIVNADDFGVTPGVCAGIRRAHAEGVVTTTTAMMNMPCAADELRRTHVETPGLGLGVHLTLTAGRPLSPEPSVAGLLDSAGNFLRPPKFVRRLETLRLEEVEREWVCQIEAFLGLGLELDHLDSHHHTSYLSPHLLDLMLELASRFGCAIRPPFTEDETALAREMLANSPPEGAAHARDALQASVVTHADRLYVSFFNSTATLERLLEILATLPEGTSEIMCHPGLQDDELRRVSDYSDKRQQELECLVNERVRQSVRELGIHLCRYSDLHV